ACGRAGGPPRGRDNRLPAGGGARGLPRPAVAFPQVRLLRGYHRTSGVGRPGPGPGRHAPGRPANGDPHHDEAGSLRRPARERPGRPRRADLPARRGNPDRRASAPRHHRHHHKRHHRLHDRQRPHPVTAMNAAKENKKPRRGRLADRRGVVLIAGLLVVAILSLASYQYAELMLAEYKASENAVRYPQARLAAESGVHYPAALMADTANAPANPWG